MSFSNESIHTGLYAAPLHSVESVIKNMSHFHWQLMVKYCTLYAIGKGPVHRTPTLGPITKGHITKSIK